MQLGYFFFAKRVNIILPFYSALPTENNSTVSVALLASSLFMAFILLYWRHFIGCSNVFKFSQRFFTN